MGNTRRTPPGPSRFFRLMQMRGKNLTHLNPAAVRAPKKLLLTPKRINLVKLPVCEFPQQGVGMGTSVSCLRKKDQDPFDSPKPP